MIPNVLNALIGVALIYAAILHPALISGGLGPLLTAAVVMFSLAYWARHSDHHPWQSSVNMVLAVVLAAITLLQLARVPLATFWGVFWIGMIVAVLSLWAAIYRPRPLGIP
jgi:hypothetical protein